MITSSKTAPSTFSTSRLQVLFIFFIIAFSLISARLFYWQVIKRNDLSALAESQYIREFTSTAPRGKIYTADGYLLVDNDQAYRTYIIPSKLTKPLAEIAPLLAPLITQDTQAYQVASSSADLKDVSAITQQQILDRVAQSQSQWISITSRTSAETKAQLEALDLDGLAFESYPVRKYQEASMAAHTLGFVAKDESGQDVGYFGIEGALNKELLGKDGKQLISADAHGMSLNQDIARQVEAIPGRDVTLTIRRDTQQLIEKELKNAIQQYGAAAGEILVMEAGTGKILGAATWPHYEPEHYFTYDQSYHKNPSLAKLYEPGSTFKVLTVAAGIDAGVITPETECPTCAGPRTLGNYTIRTWNNQYHPNTTIKEALANSDNTAMIYVAEQLGSDKFIEYLKKFGIGQSTQIELQEDWATNFPEKWGGIELATRSFGQGIVANSLQMVQAVSVIANDGLLLKPTIVEKVFDNVTGETIETQPIIETEVVTPQTADTVTEMMVYAAAKGEAQWIAAQDFTVAAKTGTSQIAIEGGYDQDKTIASFIGFSPAEQPKFIMLVKLEEPTSSIWASETAAPLWYKVARQLHLLL